MLERVDDLVLELDGDGHILYANRTYMEFGSEAILGKVFADLLPARSRKRLNQALEQVFEEGLQRRLHIELGEGVNIRYFAARIMPTSDERPVTKVLLIAQDISERRQEEDAFNRLALFQEAVIENGEIWLHTADPEGRIILWNQAAERISGFTRDEVVGTDDIWQGLYPDADYLESVKAQQLSILEQYERGQGYETTITCKDGSERRMLWYARTLSDGDGPLLGTVSQGLDITERIETEDVQRRLEHAVRSAAEAVVITDTQGIIKYVNPAACSSSGYTEEEMLGQNPRVLKSGHQDEAFYADMWNTLNAGKVWRGCFINKRKDGTIYNEEAVISPMCGEHGEILHFVAVKRDVTQELELEANLRQAQKMEAVGTMAGGVAHDFNNLLLVIISNATFLEYELPEGSQMREDLDEITSAARRASELSRQLLAFSRRQPMALKTLELGKVVVNIHKMLSSLIGENIKLKLITHEEHWQIKADPGQMEQILVNLVVNARDVMPGGGRLLVETASVNLSEESAVGLVESEQFEPGEYVMLSVTDSGEGMPLDVQKHIFEPFFTTKEQGEGTGLGLSMVYGIVKQHGGFMSVYSEIGQGTTFRLYFPRSSKDNIVPVGLKKSNMPGGDETILLVEDENTVRRSAMRLLTRLGYNVLEAADGPSALSVAANYEGAIHLLFTDIIMPGMDGVEVFHQLHEVRPNTQVIFASGYPKSYLSDTGRIPEGFSVMRKPFDVKEMANVVRVALDRAY